jgi:glycosyltransferase involved in cell wall biosynthesis
LALLARELSLDLLEAPEFAGLTAFLNLFRPPALRVVVRLHTCSAICRALDSHRPASFKGRFKNGLQDWLERRAIETADRVTAISNATVDLTKRVLGLRRDDFHVTPNPVNDLFFSPTESEQIPGEPLVLFVGRLEWIKGPDLLIRALPTILKRHPNVRFCLAGGDTNTAPGGGSMLAYLSCLTPENARAHVEFTGFLTPEQLSKKYRRATVCVFPSRWEGFGLVAAEAMACGKATVVTDVGGLRDVVADGETGVVVKGEAPESLASALDTLLSDAPLRARLGAAAREAALARFHGTVIAEAMVSAYRAAMVGA